MCYVCFYLNYFITFPIASFVLQHLICISKYIYDIVEMNSGLDVHCT